MVCILLVLAFGSLLGFSLGASSGVCCLSQFQDFDHLLFTLPLLPGIGLLALRDLPGTPRRVPSFASSHFLDYMQYVGWRHHPKAPVLLSKSERAR